MTRAKRVRWECPNGLHPAVLGSTRPARDSIVRFCLPCSETAGRLVERRAPALERQRAARTVARQQRAQSAKEREAERLRERFTVDGRDLRDEMRRLLGLAVWRDECADLARRPPELTVTRRTAKPRSRLGFCEAGGGRIHIALYPGLSWADACETLLHELAHACVERVRPREAWHGSYWQSVFRTALREAYGVEAEVRRVHAGLLNGVMD